MKEGTIPEENYIGKELYKETKLNRKKTRN